MARRRILLVRGSLDQTTMMDRTAAECPGHDCASSPFYSDRVCEEPAALSRLGGPLLVIGAGSIGTRHLRNLQRLGARRLVVHRTGHGRKRAFLPDVALEPDLDAALDHRPVAALVCNPSALHVPAALAAARAGCHLFLEKPVSHSLVGLDDLAVEVDARGLTVLVGFQFRFHPAFRRMKAWIESGVIGEVVSARAHWGEHLPGWHPFEDYRSAYSARRDLGGGVVLTLCHPFDYLRWLLGEVEAVAAVTAQRSGLELDVEDAAQVLLRFRNGVLGTVSLDYAERPPRHELHVVGRRGSIRWSDADDAARLFDGETGRVEVAPPPDGFDRNRMFLEEMRHFVACLTGDERPACTFEDGVAALRVALAAKRAAAERRTVRV